MIRFARRTGFVALIAAVTACSSNGNSAPAPAVVPTAVATAAPTPTAAPTAAPAAAFAYTRAPGLFYAQGTGPTRPALDCIAANGSYSLSSGNITLSAMMNGPIAVGAPNYYVWGINRGSALPPGAFPGEPNVVFDAVLAQTVNADGTFAATLTTLGAGGASTAIGSTAMSVVGNVITVSITSGLLPSTGLAPSKYTWNLWPRSGVGGSSTAQIASFCPENAVLPMVVVP